MSSSFVLIILLAVLISALNGDHLLLRFVYLLWDRSSLWHIQFFLALTSLDFFIF